MPPWCVCSLRARAQRAFKGARGDAPAMAPKGAKRKRDTPDAARIGGSRQRLLRAGLQAPARDEEPESALVAHLLKEIAWGRLTAGQAQRIASAAEADLLWSVEHSRCHPRVQKMAAAGSRGDHSGDVARDIKRMAPEAKMADALARKLVHLAFWKGASKLSQKARWRGLSNHLPMI